jgi:hypothetical protein
MMGLSCSRSTEIRRVEFIQELHPPGPAPFSVLKARPFLGVVVGATTVRPLSEPVNVEIKVYLREFYGSWQLPTHN